MDITILYKGKQQVVANVSSFEDLEKEIVQEYPYIHNLQFSYQDEEGDVIQVSNTSDLIAITDFAKTILNLDAEIDNEKLEQEEKRRQEKLIQMKQKKIEEQRIQIENQIQEQEIKIQELEQQIENSEQQHSSDCEHLKKNSVQIQSQKQIKENEFKQGQDFQQVLNTNGFVDQVREKESLLLMLEGQKEFEIQLRTMQQEVHEIFRIVYEKRVQQFKQTFDQLNSLKKEEKQINEYIIQTQKNHKKQREELNEKLKNAVTKLSLLQNELLRLNEIY